MKTKISILIYCLLVLGFFTDGITSVVGLVMAYIFIGDADQGEKTHFSYQIRSFWIFILYAVVSLCIVGLIALALIGQADLLVMAEQARAWDHGISEPQYHALGIQFGSVALTYGALIIMIVPFILLAVFVLGRFLKGFRLALKKQPIPNPKTWLI